MSRRRRRPGGPIFGADPIALAEAVISARSPVLWYKFDDGSGSQLTDYSGNADHGVLPAATATPTWDASGFLDFDGTDDRVDVPTLAGTWEGCDIVFQNDDTLNAALSRQALFSQNDSGILFGTSSGQLTNEIITVKQNTGDGYGAQGSRAWAHATNDLTGGSWHLIQCDRVGTTTWNIYLDGTQIDTTTGSGGAPLEAMRTGATVPWGIGQASDGDPLSAPFDGKIAYLVLYPTLRDATSQAACRTALTTLMADRGITLP